jgi:vacuolar protein sorting-associated protein IST1
MFSSGPDLNKLKTNLRLSINRLKLLEKKKTENALKARKEIADYITAGKDDRARIRVEHIIREDYYVEAMELVEMYCDLLLARFGLIQTQKELDAGLEEAIATLIWVSPRMQADVSEIKCVGDLLSQKYGKEFAQECRQNRLNNVSEKVMHKLSVQAPPKPLVEKYLCEIARSYNIPFDPDPCLIEEGPGDDLINLDGSAVAGGGILDHRYYQSSQQPGSVTLGGIGSPPPSVVGSSSNNPTITVGGPSGQIGFVENPAGFGTGLVYPSPHLPHGIPGNGFQPPPFSSSEKPPLPPDNPVGYPIGRGSAPPAQGYDLNGQLREPPPLYTSMEHVPYKQINDGNNLHLPEIPTLPSPATSALPGGNNSVSPSNTSTDVDFDDLTRRFDELKKRK